jgi:hypothetical protein
MVAVPSTVVPAQIQERVRGLGRAWSLRVLQFLEKHFQRVQAEISDRQTSSSERRSPWSVGESLLLADGKCYGLACAFEEMVSCDTLH